MGFSIFASGTGQFHHQVADCIDGSDFDAIQIVQTIRGINPWDKTGRLLDAVGLPEEVLIGRSVYKAANTLIKGPPKSDTMTRTAMEKLATVEFIHLLDEAVDFLAMRPNLDHASISIFARKTHTLWPDTVRFASYNFTPGDSPGVEFVQTITPALAETGLNNWGVMRALAMVLNRYSDHIEDTKTVPMINFQISH
jgi:hypothetical protein